jgi:MFS family permease
VLTVSAPEVERAFASRHATFALLTFVVPGVIALVCEPLIFLLADRYPRRMFVRVGTGAITLGALGAALAPGPITFALALSVLWVALGTASGLAQAILVDAAPDARGRTLARWSMWSLGGDLAAPALLALLAWLGAGWRAAFVAVAVIAAIDCMLLARAPLEAATREPAEDDAPTQGLLATLRDALRDRTLVAWLFGCTLCDLLDEILVVFASLHLRAHGATAFEQMLTVAAFTVGGALGLVALDRVLRVRSERWTLVAASLATLVSFVAWLAIPILPFALLVGAAIAPLYPLAAAQAYATRPGSSGSVLAAQNLFTPLALALPWLIGLVADAAGTTVALAVLAVQPIGLVVLVAASRTTSPTTSQSA